MDTSSLFKLIDRLGREKFFGKLEIKFRDGLPYFCIRQEFFQVAGDRMTQVEPMSQTARKTSVNLNLQET
jgi:hypothetical protein